MTGIELPGDAVAQITTVASEVVQNVWPIAALVAGVLLAVGIALYLVGGVMGGSDDDENEIEYF